MRLSWRLRPAVVVNAALATTLLAAVAAGDAGPSAVPGPDIAAGVPDAAPPGSAAGAPERATASPSPEPTGASTQALPAFSLASARLAEALAPLADAGKGTRLSVAVLDLHTGAGAGYGEGLFDTASIVKVDILAALLLMAQDEGRELTAHERELADIMIRRSDNDAAHELWDAIGGPHGLDAANARLGLIRTEGGGNGHWGLTQTTSADQLALLRAIYTADSPLDAGSRGYIRHLMDLVVDGQHWGISAAADHGDFELKNGWLPRSQTGLWDVNSIGRVVADGREYLLAVVSDGHPTHAAGIAMVEAAARAAVEALSTELPPADPGV